MTHDKQPLSGESVLLLQVSSIISRLIEKNRGQCLYHKHAYEHIILFFKVQSIAQEIAFNCLDMIHK